MAHAFCLLRPSGCLFPVPSTRFCELLFCCSAPPPPAFCRYGVFRFRCLVSRPRFLHCGFVTDLFLGPAASSWLRLSLRVLPFVAAPAASCSGLFRLLPVALLFLRLADYLFVADCNRSVAFVPCVSPVSFPHSRRPCSCFFVLSSQSCCSLVVVAYCRFFLCSLSYWLFPPVCVAPVVLPVCCSGSFSRLRNPAILIAFLSGPFCWFRLPDSASPVFAIMRLPRYVAPSRLLGCVAPLLRFASRFPVLLVWLRPPCACCFLYLLYLLLRFLSSQLYCSVAPSRLLPGRFVSPASSGFVAPLRLFDCVAPLRLFSLHSVFVFGALRARLEREILSALLRAK